MRPCRIDEPVNGRAWCHDCQVKHSGHAVALSQEMSEKAQAWRDSKKKSSITTKARSYISTLSQHVLNNFAEVPAEVREQRQAICNGCDKRDPVKNACKVCGCKLEKTFLGDKLAWAVSSCPLGKWQKFDTTPLTMFGEMEKWQQAYHENPPASGGISGVENPNVSFENSMTESNKLLLNAIRFDHENLHTQVIPGLRFNSTIIEQA